MKRLLVTGLVLASMVYLSGCASYMSYKASENEIYAKRVMASGDAAAINVLRSGAEPKAAIRAIQDPAIFGIGIDLLALDVLKEHPWRQTGAAILDALTVYAVSEGIDYVQGDGNSSASSRDVNVSVSDSQNTTVNVSGDSVTDTDTTSHTDDHSNNNN